MSEVVQNVLILKALKALAWLNGEAQAQPYENLIGGRTFAYFDGFRKAKKPGLA